jgi:hypothetical protein
MFATEQVYTRRRLAIPASWFVQFNKNAAVSELLLCGSEQKALSVRLTVRRPISVWSRENSNE